MILRFKNLFVWLLQYHYSKNAEQKQPFWKTILNMGMKGLVTAIKANDLGCLPGRSNYSSSPSIIASRSVTGWSICWCSITWLMNCG